MLTQHLGHDHRADPARAVGDVMLVAVIEDCLVLPIVEQDIQAMRPPRGGEGCTTLLGHEGKDKLMEREKNEQRTRKTAKGSGDRDCEQWRVRERSSAVVGS